MKSVSEHGGGSLVTHLWDWSRMRFDERSIIPARIIPVSVRMHLKHFQTCKCFYLLWWLENVWDVATLCYVVIWLKKAPTSSMLRPWGRHSSACWTFRPQAPIMRGCCDTPAKTRQVWCRACVCKDLSCGSDFFRLFVRDLNSEIQNIQPFFTSYVTSNISYLLVITCFLVFSYFIPAKLQCSVNAKGQSWRIGWWIPEPTTPLLRGFFVSCVTGSHVLSRVGLSIVTLHHWAWLRFKIVGVSSLSMREKSQKCWNFYIKSTQQGFDCCQHSFLLTKDCQHCNSVSDSFLEPACHCLVDVQWDMVRSGEKTLTCRARFLLRLFAGPLGSGGDAFPGRVHCGFNSMELYWVDMFLMLWDGTTEYVMLQYTSYTQQSHIQVLYCTIMVYSQ